MKDSLVRFRNAIIRFLYVNVLKQVFFKFDPEVVHDRLLGAGKFLGRFWITRILTRFFFSYSNLMLEQEILGIKFKNPIGLAAGFDKNAEILDILPDVGFGFAEIGSITGEPCAGNVERPRLWRLLKSKSLVVYYGLKNDGAETVVKRLTGKKYNIPFGISVAKTNCQATAVCEAGIADYNKALMTSVSVGDYYTINISCPNAFGGQPFTDPESLEKLMVVLDKVETKKPIFLKFSPDYSFEQIDALLEVCDRHRVHGFISSNLTKIRENKNIHDTNIPDVGGMSGKVVEGMANNLIGHLYKKTKGKYVIVGCGGVFSAEDAYLKIRLGSSLIQLVTGMIFEGPQSISAINEGLVRLLKQDGYKNISEAIGTAHK
jgi:dihydroorotate dehydrogenase